MAADRPRNTSSNVRSLRPAPSRCKVAFPHPRRFSDLVVGLILISIVAAGAYVAYDDVGEPLPLPNSGALTLNRPLLPNEATAPFTVVPDGTNPKANYFIKISEWESKVQVATLFVGAAQPAKVQLPLGTYRMTIAQGEKWYGPERLFGSQTVVNEGLKPSVFYQSAPHQTVGATLTLAPKFAGNYPMKPVGRLGATGLAW